jgi:hypothetical protein
VCVLTIPVLGRVRTSCRTEQSYTSGQTLVLLGICNLPELPPAPTSDLRFLATSEISCTYLPVTGYLSRYSDSLRRSHPGGSETFRTRPDRPWGPHSPLHNGYRVPSPRVKRPGCGTVRPPPSSAEVKERVQLYTYSPSGPLWPVLGRILPLPVPLMCTLGQVTLQTCPYGGFQTTRRHISSHTLHSRSAESH